MRDVTRRRVVQGLAAGMPLAAVLADPLLAKAAGESLESVAVTTVRGRRVKGALALPSASRAPAVLLVHEWWGLNDQIKSVARELANLGYVALALDLYGGVVATTPDEARAAMQALNEDDAKDTVAAWTTWLSGEAPQSNGKIGTVGWCLGGGWSLMASILRPVDATVVYYGKVDRPAEQLARLKGPVLGHFAKQDKWINAEMVGKFEATMKEVGKPYTDYWYDANHAFANPTGNSYAAGPAALAWRRTTAFFEENLK